MRHSAAPTRPKTRSRLALHYKSGGQVNIYIDESGSFVNASTVGAWNAVAALAVPEAAEEKIDQLLPN